MPDKNKLDFSNNLMIYVAWAVVGGERRNEFMKRWISADMGFPAPDRPLTDTEMQPVVHAAKMALAKVLRNRERGGK